MRLNSSLTGHKSVEGSYSDCRSGSKTFGSSSNVKAVIFYYNNENYSGIFNNSNFKVSIKSEKKNIYSYCPNIRQLSNVSSEKNLN